MPSLAHLASSFSKAGQHSVLLEATHLPSPPSPSFYAGVRSNHPKNAPTPPALRSPSSLGPGSPTPPTPEALGWGIPSQSRSTQHRHGEQPGGLQLPGSCLQAQLRVLQQQRQRERLVMALLKPVAVTAQTSQAPMPLPSPSDI